MTLKFALLVTVIWLAVGSASGRAETLMASGGSADAHLYSFQPSAASVIQESIPAANTSMDQDYRVDGTIASSSAGSGAHEVTHNAATHETYSLIFFGSGLIGLAGTVRRRLVRS